MEGFRDLGLKNKKYYLNECIKKLAPLELKNSIEYKNYVLKIKNQFSFTTLKIIFQRMNIGLVGWFI